MDSPHYISLSHDDSEHDENTATGNTPLSPVRTKPPTATRAAPPAPLQLGIGVWVPLAIVGGTLLAAVVAILHHLFDTHFDGRGMSGTWTQTNTGRVEIFFATAYRILFSFSAGISFCQLTWYSLRRQPVTVADMDVLFGAPSLMNLRRLNLVLQTPIIMAMTVAILAAPIITILAPSLNTHQASTAVRTLTVPTLNTTTDAVQNDVLLSVTSSYGTVTDLWNKTALTALLSESPAGWTIPDGCSPECSYSFTYAAPALRCTDLQPNQIADRVDPIYQNVNRTFQDPPAAYLLAYDANSDGAGYQSSPLNFTVQNDATAETDQYTWTLAYVPYLAANEAPGALINATGAACVFYSATHIANTHYFNGTQESSVTVGEFHEPLNTTYRQNGGFTGTSLFLNSSQPGTVFSPGVGGQIHLLAIADAISAHLAGDLVLNTHFSILTSTTLVMETNLFEPYNVETLNEIRATNAGINTTAVVTDISQALEDLVANVTLGFVNLAMGTATVNASVNSQDLVFVYNRKTLIATYASTFAALVVMSLIGMFCLLKNGESSSNSFSRLLLASRNSELDVVVDAMVENPGLKANGMRLIEPALDVLWKYQPTLTNILACMSPDLWELPGAESSTLRARRPIEPGDWKRFHIYARRVRTLGIHTSEKGLSVVLDMLAISRPVEHLFPNLQELDWYPAPVAAYLSSLFPLVRVITTMDPEAIREDESERMDMLNDLWMEVEGILSTHAQGNELSEIDL
ncbi:hypothetical protein C8R45DRAFT_1220122 [Mycena sanguinolenta]|nr:hypothetical protein C8R45DRAFT_1220122 [Mycena sanguinolenta]